MTNNNTIVDSNLDNTKDNIVNNNKDILENIEEVSIENESIEKNTINNLEKIQEQNLNDEKINSENIDEINDENKSKNENSEPKKESTEKNTMDEIKNNAIKLKNGFLKFTNNTIEKTYQKMIHSSLCLKTQQDIEDFVQNSKNTEFTNSEGIVKTFTKRVLVIFGDFENEDFKKIVLLAPILMTKSFSQNVKLKIVNIKNTDVDIAKYNFDEFPNIVIFENTNIYKIIYGVENINKVVKKINLDINKSIEEI